MKILQLILGFSLFLLAPTANAQLGNEWINPAQSYVRIQVAQDGLFRVTGTQLIEAGLSPASAAALQLFHHGREVAIRVNDGGDLQFDAADYLEFYGWKNLAGQDAELYRTGEAVNPYFNLFTDSSAYFLTYGVPGKRMPVIGNSGAVNSPATSHLREILQVRAESWANGDGIQNLGIYTSTWDPGEGFIGQQITTNNSLEYTLEGITGIVSGDGLPELGLRLVGRGVMLHGGEIYVGTGDRLVATPSFNGFNSLDLQIPLEWSDITADGKLRVRVKVTGVDGNPDRFSVAYLKVTFPQITSQEGALNKTFVLRENIGEIQTSLQNLPATARVFDITQPYNVRELSGVDVAGRRDLRVSATDSAVLFATQQVLTPVVKPVKFSTYPPAEYIIITHPSLRQAAGGYADPVTAYAAYRASAEGGGYDTLVANITDLYNQFGYGETTPLAIYRFMRYCVAQGSPKYLFLVGKALEPYYSYTRKPGNYTTYKDLVPTAGFPGSDVQFTTGLAGTTYEPAVPTGRITVMNGEQVAAYLDKIREKESGSGDLWQKRLLHLSGGIEEGEPELFRSYLEGMAEVATNDYLGGEVLAVAKRSRDLQFINIANQINEGVGLVTFYGHSSPNTLDFDVGYVSNPVLGYANKGKYPVMLMNGCEAGAFFLNFYIFGEDWIFARDKGASAFIAHSSYGLQSTLKLYAETFYNVGFADSLYIHKGIGDIQREVIRQYIEKANPSTANLAQVNQMILLGDPAVRMLESDQCDLRVEPGQIRLEAFNGAEISALSDSLALKVVLANLGSTRKGQTRIEVRRKLQDNSEIIYDSIIPITRFTDTLQIVLRQTDLKPYGLNSFEVIIDADNIIPEANEQNNRAEYEFFIPVNATRNLFPGAFSVVPASPVDLVFQSTNTSDALRDYFLEVDTTAQFNSPWLKKATLSGRVFLRQPLEFSFTDTTAIFWRTRFAVPLAGENTAWEVSSFTYIPDGYEGWAQVHPEQMAMNTLDGMELSPGKKFAFTSVRTTLDIMTFGALAGKPRDSVSVKIGGAEYNLYAQAGGGFGCRNNTLNFIAFDKRTSVPYVGLYFKWYESGAGRRVICGREPFVINSFQPQDMATGNNDDIPAYVNAVADGDTVLIFSIGNAAAGSWPAAAISSLSSLGISADQLGLFAPNEPIVIIGKKGGLPGSAQIYRADVDPATARLKVSTGISGSITSGTITSPPIGPSESWKNLYWKNELAEEGDSVSGVLYGLTFEGSRTPIQVIDDKVSSLTSLDAGQFPYLQLEFFTSDEAQVTPVQPRHWGVEYTPVPEGILLSDLEPISLLEGDSARLQFKFVNISSRNFSGVLPVVADLINEVSGEHRRVEMSINPPAPGDTSRFSVAFSTIGMRGYNDVSIQVNRKVVAEQYYDNNEAELLAQVRVLMDAISPVLDVTIDGRYPVNGDYVSAQPEIRLRILDENRIFLKTDTTEVHIFLTRPCDEEPCTAERISFSSEAISWTPQTTENPFTVVFKPELSPGEYVLQAVGSDASGNLAGEEPYTVSFLVSDSIGVSFAKPFPNPALGVVFFEITCSGLENPELESLEIVNSMGQLVYRTSTTLIAGINTLEWDSGERGIFFYRAVVRSGNKRFSSSGKIIRS